MENCTFLEELTAASDAQYRDFMAKLIPTVPKERVIGVRTGSIREIAKGAYGTARAEKFMEQAPHAYFEQNQLHAFMIMREKDFRRSLGLVRRFLPLIDNWATCDQLVPPPFGRNAEALVPDIREWMEARHTYTVRFSVGLLMRHFLDERFSPEWPQMVAGIPSQEYYVRMMAAWYFATALAKQYDAVIPYLEKRMLPMWTHNKAIQKAVESRRLSGPQKEHLRALRA